MFINYLLLKSDNGCTVKRLLLNSVDEKNMVILKGWFPSSCVALHEDERVKYLKEAQQQHQEEEEVNDDVEFKKEK